MLNRPHILTIKLFATGDLPTLEMLNAMLEDSPHNLSLLSMDAMPMKFDGHGLVPIKAPPAPKEEPAAKAPKSSPAPKVPSSRKPIHFEPGSATEKIWLMIDGGPAVTSTQVREKLNISSAIVNTTLYRLKNAGMIRPMSHTATNGDTLYTSTRHDKKE
jgi:hypothetical protein